MDPWQKGIDHFIGLARRLLRNYETAKSIRPEAFNAERTRKEREEILKTLQKVKDSGGKAFKERDHSGYLTR